VDGSAGQDPGAGEGVVFGVGGGCRGVGQGAFPAVVRWCSVARAGTGSARSGWGRVLVRSPGGGRFRGDHRWG
jgi:hypothetical protein